MADFVLVVQARMSSSRFPGKVLAPLRGQPLIAHVLRRLVEVPQARALILVTSEDRSDDPLAAYARNDLGVSVFRGDLNNVVARFQGCLRKFPCEWFVRISGDSPLIDPRLVSAMWGQMPDSDCDILTNVAPRTFPPGQSVEIVRTSALLALDATALDRDEQEHVTLHFYRNPERFRILNVRSVDPSIASKRFVVDSVEDLRALEVALEANPRLGDGFDRLVETAH